MYRYYLFGFKSNGEHHHPARGVVLVVRRAPRRTHQRGRASK